jgi:NADPH:quinone reductase-like Zn-dependent oxidoreductase
MQAPAAQPETQNVETTRRETFKAAVRARFGSPEQVVEVREIEKPTPGDDEVLVRVHAASLNLGDWYAVVGRPYIGRPSMGLREPKELRIGADYAGTVEAVGANVVEFHPGDEVFGGRTGAFAEYIVARADRAIVPKPAHVTFEEAATVAVAGTTALQALRDKGQLRPGEKVLINGASGSVGTFAVSIAKALGAEVTAVCSMTNVDQARSLGADHVIDYTHEDFTRGGRRYDLIADVAGGRSWSDLKRVLEPTGRLVIIGGPKANRLMGPLASVLRKYVAGRFSSRKVIFFIAKLSKADMEVLRGMLESGQVKPAIDTRYELSQIAEALDYMGDGHARGKIVITM